MENELTVRDEIPGTRELIEVHVTESRLLSSTRSTPSPLREKDRPKAEEFIVSWPCSARRDAQLGLQVYVDGREYPMRRLPSERRNHEFFGRGPAECE